MHSKIGLQKLIFILSVFVALCHPKLLYSETYTIEVGKYVDVSQTPYQGGYIDNVGLAYYIDPHLGFSKNPDGSARITVNSYFDYTITVQLVFIERYQAWYNGRYHTKAETYYKNVDITCKYVEIKPVKPTKVLLPKRVKVKIGESEDITPTLEPSGATASDVDWHNSLGTAVFACRELSETGKYRITGRSVGIGRAWVVIDKNDDLRAETIVEVVDPNYPSPDAVFLPSSVEISIGKHTSLEPILVPEGSATTYTWNSDNESVATVSSGKVYGVKRGSSTITLKTANGLTATCAVTVVQSNGKDDDEDNNDKTKGSVGGHDYVDLGLSVKWATCNVGATTPEEFGSYFAWGETTEKSTFSWSNYSYGSGANNMTNIGSDISGTKYDAAYAKWGKDWRMPTEKEISELTTKCKFNVESINGVDGYLVTGPNGNTIFIPIAGYKDKSFSSSSCDYWGSIPYDNFASILQITNNKYKKVSARISDKARYYGIPIRAVTTASETSNILISGITLNSNYVTLAVNDTYPLTATVSPSNATNKGVKWSSNKPSIATVNESTGLVTAKAEGKATITCEAKDGSGVKATCEVTVEKKSVEPTSITVSPYSKTIKVGGTFTPTYTLSPSNATTTVKWSSDNSSIASVNENTGEVKGVKAGTTKVWAKTSNNKSDYCSVTVEANGVEINATNFPDQNFRDYISLFDENKDGGLSENEISKVANIIVGSKDISSLKGIEYFTALDWLDCTNNKLTSLDVSKNTALTRLHCYDNQLMALDVSKNTALKYLYCRNNQLMVLDVSKNTALTVLSCYSNQLTSLDVSKNTALTGLWCYNNKLTALDVSRNTAMTTVVCWGNNIKGQTMDKLIESLPKNTTDEIHRFYAYNPNAENEGNGFTTKQVNAAKAKGWTPCYSYNSEWVDFEGSQESSEYKDGDFIIAKTEEGVDMSFQIISTTDKTCQVIGSKMDMQYTTFFGDPAYSAINVNYSGSLSIPNYANGYRVIKLGNTSFANCNVESITISEGILYIGYQAFSPCENLSSLVIPNSVISIDSDIIAGCSKLKTVISFIQEPFDIDEAVFWINWEQFTPATLYVPKGTKSAYQSRKGWSKFMNIVEFDPSTIDPTTLGIQDVTIDNMGVPFYDLLGRKFSQPRKGINIIGGKKIVVK
jgi:uncharacterized protein YjdB